MRIWTDSHCNANVKCCRKSYKRQRPIRTVACLGFRNGMLTLLITCKVLSTQALAANLHATSREPHAVLSKAACDKAAQCDFVVNPMWTASHMRLCRKLLCGQGLRGRRGLGTNRDAPGIDGETPKALRGVRGYPFPRQCWNFLPENGMYIFLRFVGFIKV